MLNFWKNNLFWFLKVTLTTFVFYVGLYFFAGKNLELKDSLTNDLNFKELYFDRYLTGFSGHSANTKLVQSGVELIFSNSDKHFSSEAGDYKKDFQKSCLENLFLCVKVNFVGDFSYYQKYIYFSSVAYLVDFFENNLDEGDMYKSLQQIKIISDGGERRGYTSWGKITMNMDLIASDEEFFEVLSHEMFHVFDLAFLQGESEKKDKYYTEFSKSVFSIDDPSLNYYMISWDSESKRSAHARKTDFCSLYGQTDPFEDFAECGNLYINHNSLFKFLTRENVVLKEKYAFFSEFFGGEFLNSDLTEINLVKENTEYRVWDTTKM